MSTNPSDQPATLERDPVCGMNVNPATAKHVYAHGGKNYYFCCAGCAEKFKADPAKYLTDSTRTSLGTSHAGRRKVAAIPLLFEMSIETPPQVKPQPTHGQRQPLAQPTSAPCAPRSAKPSPELAPPAAWRSNQMFPLASTRTEYTCPMHPEIVRPGARCMSHLRHGARAPHGYRIQPKKIPNCAT